MAMKLAELFQGIEVKERRGQASEEVCDIAYRAEDARPGSCFVAIRGTAHDGHDFAEKAVERGASVVVSERRLSLGDGVLGIVVRDARLALGLLAARFCGDPSSALTLVGVTGTNGKTTTTYLLESILRAAGRTPGVIGTIAYRYGGHSEPAPHTTPQSLDLQRLLQRMRDAGCGSCAMEVSSHALTQERAAGCRFDAGIFTNLTPEHLDYHRDMEDYFNAKAILFERLLAEGGKPSACAVINADDPYGRLLAKRSAVPVALFGIASAPACRQAGAEVMGAELSCSADGLSMRVETPAGSFACRSKLCGRFNAQNILAAVACCVRLGIGLEAIREGIAEAPAVPGRFEPIPNARGVLALVDYAHTPDALEKALSHARELVGSPAGRVLAVFGCGGDRDRRKRPLMGRAAASLADVVIVTSDNPRTEEPKAIIDEILPGVRLGTGERPSEGSCEVIVDRREAIARAVELAKEGDVLVVAGKGHEDYQIVGRTRRHFDDREVLAELFGAKDGNEPCAST
jgi:UDP-N-acetylmuramoyl-L-alanyl-D-glutamate--2,6-diaminopimelate ligase